MKSSEFFNALNPILRDTELIPHAECIMDKDGDVVFWVRFTSVENYTLEFKFQIAFDRHLLKEKVEELTFNKDLHVEVKDIEVFLEHKFFALLPYIHEYNSGITDYQKLAELYHDSRGFLIGKRFNF